MPWTRWGILLPAVMLGLGNGVRLIAQTVPQSPAPNPPSVKSLDSTYTIKAQRNLVIVRVIVRDRSGKAVTGLHKEDFRLFDNGKAQAIDTFSIETPEGKGNTAAPKAGGAPGAAAAPATNRPATTPSRFVAFYFDDVHLPFEDAVRTRDAAKKYLASSLRPGDRAAIISSSGHLAQDFTADRDKLTEVIDKLQPRPLTSTNLKECPDISPYLANQIVDFHNQDAIQLVTLDLIACRCNGDAQMCSNVGMEISGDAMRVLAGDEEESRATLSQLESLVRHLAAMPGERNIVFVSPGFFSRSLEFDLSEIIQRALNSRVVINTFDSRGLFTIIPGGDASAQEPSTALPQYMILKTQFDRDSLMTNADVLGEIADATGGVFFHNSNDYDGGFQRTGALPEASYVLGFSPQNLKLNGAYHKLKVTLAQGSGLSLQARHGYYAPRQAEDPVARAKDEIKEAVFSRDEMQELPMAFKTQFFKSDALNATLSVLAHVDLSRVQFRKEQGLNLDNLTLVAALFDDDGNYVTGQEETVQMRLKDSSLEKLARTGIIIKAKLDTKVGNYTVRVVVQDSQSARMAAASEPVEIPY